MIRLILKGDYRIIETKNRNRLLILDNRRKYAWETHDGIGEILTATHKPQREDHILAQGKYRLYFVEEEPDLADLTHLEMHEGKGQWQGYLLPLGFPYGKKVRSKIIPTGETITQVSRSGNYIGVRS